MPNLRNREFRYLFALVLWFVILGAIYSQKQTIEDDFALYNYRAPAAIVQLANQDQLTAYARRILYVNHPVLDDKTQFNIPCPNNGGEQTIVLGCYHSNQAGIFLLSVSDSRLNGVEQVTIAHEMLHAAYDRLTSSEKSKVDAMLLNYYNNDLHDPRILSTIAAYRRTEPGNVVNEMHSVFGTEVANLPAGLEAYYTKYFVDRSVITSYAADYQAAFTSRQNQVTTDDSQLATLKTQLDNQEALLKQQDASLIANSTQLLAERSTDPLAYNLGVDGYNNQVDAYNNAVDSVKALITQYNQLVTARNAIAVQEDQLVDELTATPASSIN